VAVARLFGVEEAVAIGQRHLQLVAADRNDPFLAGFGRRREGERQRNGQRWRKTSAGPARLTGFVDGSE
jgi:hypothetical protein